MELKIGKQLSKQEVFELLTRFDDSSDIPLREGIDFETYSDKLSKYAYFILAYEAESCLGFLAYYLNQEGKFLYIPQIIVHKEGRHQGIGHQMFDALYKKYDGWYDTIKLEVLKENLNARNFYEHEGFREIEDHNERLLLLRRCSNNHIILNP